MAMAPRQITLTPALLAALGKRVEAHKYDHGHALVLAGPPGRGGAARLAARAALRIGAGLVTLGAVPAAMAENAARLDAVMLREIADPAALTRCLGDARINALCLGPGLGQEAAAGWVAAALAARRPTVLDADALSGFQGAPDWLLSQLHPGCVLTPHEGEFARLFGASPGARSRIEAASAAARQAGCITVLKGAQTIVADPQGGVALHGATSGRAAPWLATAGSGDVLAGLICGLLARGFEPRAASETAVWLHVEAARAIGPGLIAEDLPEALPMVLRALGV